MPRWFVLMTKDENGEWAVATKSGAVCVCGEGSLTPDMPRVQWSMRSSVVAVNIFTGTIITPLPEVLVGGHDA